VAAPDPNAIGKRLYALGWRAGSVLSADHCKQVAPLLHRGGHPPWSIESGDWLIVVSQTCDIVAARLTQEPYVEVLVASARQKVDMGKAGLRSTRFLSFRAWKDGPVLEAHATNRFWIPREEFDGWGPDAERLLSARAIGRLAEWLGLRYTRPAWPNALVKRVDTQQAAFNAILSGVPLEMAEIRVAITDVDKELPDDVPYRVTVFGIMDADSYYSDPNGRAACARAFEDLLDALRKCPRIVVEEGSEFLAGDQFDWQTTRMTHPWNFANLTDAGQSD